LRFGRGSGWFSRSLGLRVYVDTVVTVCSSPHILLRLVWLFGLRLHAVCAPCSVLRLRSVTFWLRVGTFVWFTFVLRTPPPLPRAFPAHYVTLVCALRCRTFAFAAYVTQFVARRLHLVTPHVCTRGCVAPLPLVTYGYAVTTRGTRTLRLRPALRAHGSGLLRPLWLRGYARAFGTLHALRCALPRTRAVLLHGSFGHAFPVRLRYAHFTFVGYLLHGFTVALVVNVTRLRFTHGAAAVAVALVTGSLRILHVCPVGLTLHTRFDAPAVRFTLPTLVYGYTRLHVYRLTLRTFGWLRYAVVRTARLLVVLRFTLRLRTFGLRLPLVCTRLHTHVMVCRLRAHRLRLRLPFAGWFTGCGSAVCVHVTRVRWFTPRVALRLLRVYAQRFTRTVLRFAAWLLWLRFLRLPRAVTHVRRTHHVRCTRTLRLVCGYSSHGLRYAVTRVYLVCTFTVAVARTFSRLRYLVSVIWLRHPVYGYTTPFGLRVAAVTFGLRFLRSHVRVALRSGWFLPRFSVTTFACYRGTFYAFAQRVVWCLRLYVVRLHGSVTFFGYLLRNTRTTVPLRLRVQLHGSLPLPAVYSGLDAFRLRTGAYAHLRTVPLFTHGWTLRAFVALRRCGLRLRGCWIGCLRCGCGLLVAVVGYTLRTAHSVTHVFTGYGSGYTTLRAAFTFICGLPRFASSVLVTFPRTPRAFTRVNARTFAFVLVVYAVLR